jgi:hypothetical protein
MGTAQKHIEQYLFTRLMPALFFVVCQQATGQAQSVHAKLDRQAYEVGDEIRLTLSVDLVQPATVLWPTLDAPLPGMELLSDQTDSSDGQLRRRLSYLQFDTGSYLLPALPIRLLRASDTTALATAEVAFTVGLVPVDTADALRPIVERRDVDYKPIPWLLYGLIGLLVLGIGTFLFYRYYWSRRPKPVREQVARPEPVVPIDEHALQRLRSLEEKRLWQQEHVKPYYSELTDIVREYIERRFGEPALESTSAEILQRLQPHGLAPESMQALGAMLRLADTVKFAKARPLPDQHQKAMRDAVAFVEANRPLPTATPGPSPEPQKPAAS